VGVKKVTLATGKAMWKVGAVLNKVAGKPAAAGSVWVLKKVAVDPVSMRVKNWKAVQAGASLKERLTKHGLCVGCGKAFREHTKREFCTPKCAAETAETWNEYAQEKVQLAPVGGDNSLHLNCGCNRKNVFHASTCAVGLSGHRVADNIKWSETDPRYMKPDAPQRQRKLTKQEEHRERVREAQERDKGLPKRKQQGLQFEGQEPPKKRGWW
jgi:hypothetical protein